MVRSEILSDPLFFTHETTSLVKVEPILCIELQDTSCWAFDWANSEVVAIGCTNGEVKPILFLGSPLLTTLPGVVAVYNISGPLKDGKYPGEG